ncbi:histidine triad nucleotide-binding protein [Chloroflexota bacterium]
MTDCIFCKIAGGEIPSELLYEDDEIIVFRDIHPVAPAHVLIVPRKHIASLAEIPDAEAALVGRMTAVANGIARDEGIAETGYRLVINSGKDGGQVVPHLHMHLLGGEQLRISLR